MIVHGDIQPETLLPSEVDLAHRLGVGRNVVREAIKVLSEKGLVRVAQGSGTPVLPATEWHTFDQQVIAWTLECESLRDGLVDELSQLRFIIEPEVAAMAATAATTTQVLRLFEAYELMETYRTDRERGVEADILFHRRLFEACHNRLMMEFLRTVVAVLRANFELAIQVDGEVIKYLEEHLSVAEAVLHHDPDAARSAMQTLLHNNRRNLATMRGAVADRRAAQHIEVSG